MAHKRPLHAWQGRLETFGVIVLILDIHILLLGLLVAVFEAVICVAARRVLEVEAGNWKQPGRGVERGGAMGRSAQHLDGAEDLLCMLGYQLIERTRQHGLRLANVPSMSSSLMIAQLTNCGLCHEAIR